MLLLLTVSIVRAKTFGEHNCGGVAFFQSHLILRDIISTLEVRLAWFFLPLPRFEFIGNGPS